MSEEIKKMSAFEAFQKTQLTFAEAEEKAKQEAGVPKVGRFRIGEDGEYSIRILPLAPSFDADGNILPMERKGYEYPLRQLFLALKAPGKKGAKAKKINIPVIRTTDKQPGYSVDLIDTYLKIAKEMYGDDEELLGLISGNSFGGGLKWNYLHAIMVLDVSNDKERAKGPQLWQCSHSIYKAIDAAKMRLWNELREDGGQETCPISGFTGAYPVKIIRTTDKKTEYAVEIGRKTCDITEDEAQKLLELPRIHEQIFRYTRYQMEATLEFLRQYDEAHDMEVCQQSDFIESVEKLKGELPADDASHFTISGATTSSSDKEEITIDSLWREYDAIVDQDLDSKSDEYQELREKIRQYIEDNELDVRISRTKNNQQLLEELDEVLDSASKEERVPAVKKETVATASVATSEDEPNDEPETPRVRKPRPDEVPEMESETVKKDEDEAKGGEDAEPRRRLRARRLR